jgi:hypothetical protein
MRGKNITFTETNKIFGFENLYAVSHGTVTGRVTLGNWNRTERRW